MVTTVVKVNTCYNAVALGHVEVLRWVREKSAPWDAETPDLAAAELGYTDDLSNLVNFYTAFCTATRSTNKAIMM